MAESGSTPGAAAVPAGLPDPSPAAQVIEDAVPEEYRALAEAKAAGRAPAVGPVGGDVPSADGSPATAVLRAVTPPRGTTVLRAVPDPSAVPAPTVPAPAAAMPAPVAEAAPVVEPPAEEPPASTGWTGNVQLDEVAALAGRAAAAAVGGGLRGRILAVEGGYGSRRAGRRGGTGPAAVLSAMLAAVSPQTLLAAESVDAVHLPSASDPQTVFAHLRAAARHPGPLLVHLGGHLVVDKRGGGLYLTLRDSKTGTVRQDGLAWLAVVEELRTRPAEWDTLVIADLSAELSAWPYLQAPQFTDGLPLWAVVAPDPEQIGTFTRALIECLHGGRPGAGPTLTPEQVRAQVHSVIRPDALTFSAYPADRAVFKNNARQQPGPVPEPGPVPSAAAPEPPVEAVAGAEAAASAGRGPVPLLKPGVPPTVRPVRPVTLLKGRPAAEPVPVEPVPEGAVQEGSVEPAPEWAVPAVPAETVPVAPVPERAVQEDSVEPVPEGAVPEEAGPAEAVAPDPAPQAPPEDYREALGRIVATAESGDHALAAELAGTLEHQAVAAHGMIAPPVLMIRQVRAHLARQAGDLGTAVGLYREVALVLLVSAGPEDPEAQRVVTNAEACWRAIPDPAVALPLAPSVLELRAKLPGEDNRKLRSTERYAAKLAQAAAR